MAEILAGAEESPQAAAEAAAIQQIRIQSHDIIVRHESEDVARLEDIRILPGGEVQIERLSLMGSAAELADDERGARVVIGLLTLVGQRVPSDLAARMATRPEVAEARIVPGLARRWSNLR